MTDVQGSTLELERLSAEEMATRFGMARAGARPPLATYLRELWGRRHFVVSYTRASNAAMYSNSFLGQIWQVLTPLLNAAVYYFIFGLLLKTKHGIPNYIGFLTIGIFVFTYMQNSIIHGARSVTNNLNIIRALHFPRASLPLGTTAIAFQQLLGSLCALLPIVLLTGEPVRLSWLLLAPILFFESLFALGMALIIARIGAAVPDTSQFLPFVLRTWLYMSGIFYSITEFTKGKPEWVRVVLELNPGALYPELVRHALLVHPGGKLTPFVWVAAVGWAVVAVVVGLIYFWHGEEQYGRG
ncbi:MAG TPA: ABC transporter permease [Gaiellales bacterium]|nr:ABC transporter permease [Gaiellales bacterium]